METYMYKISKSIIKRECVLSKDNFKLLDFFSEYEEYENYIINLLNDPVIYEALLVANPNFILNISKFNKKAIVSTLTTYLSRMIFRATPFGVFSSVGVISLKNEKMYMKKFIRPSSEWLLELIEKIELDDDFLLFSKYKWNKNLFESEKNIKVFIQSSFYKKTKLSHKIISKSNVLDFIKCLTYEKYISLNEIILSLQNYFGHEYELIKEYVKQVIKEELLLSELRECFQNFDLLFIIDKISCIKNLERIKNKLFTIHKLFIEYENSSLGKGSDILKEIYNEMSFISDVIPIKVDLKSYPIEKNTYIFDDLANKLNIILNIELDDKNRYPYIERYKDKFEEKYGYSEYIPLLEMVDFNEGIGDPYVQKYQAEIKLSNLAFKNFIREKLIFTLKNNKEKLILSREELSKFFSKNNKYPSSLELFFTLNSDNQLVMLNDSATDRKGKSIGRFLYMFDNEYNELIPKDSVVNIIEFPKEISVLNVSNVDCRDTDRLSILFNGQETGNDISLNDILVTLSGDKRVFKFYNKNTGVQLEFSVLSALNYNNTNNFSHISRFLLEATSEQYKNPLNFHHVISEVVGEIGYSPDIELENLIIYPKRWVYSKLNTKDEKSNLIRFLKKWEIPDLIVYSEDDKYLYFNLSNKVHFDIFFKKILNSPKKQIKIYDQASLKNKEGCTTEYIVALEKESSNCNIAENITLYQNDSFVLGDEWISIKYYDLGYLEKEFLNVYLKKFIDSLILKNVIDKFFYVAYSDPDKHIRVRLHVSNQSSFFDVLKEINEFNKLLRNNKIVNRIVFDTYMRETERYGGKDLMLISESIFYIDSMACLQEEKGVRSINNIQFYSSVLKSTLKYLFDLGLTIDELINIFDFEDTSLEISSLYRNIKEEDKNFLRNLIDLSLRKKVFIIKEEKQFSQLRNQLSEEKHTTLIRSLVHMHFNRLLIDNDTELKLLKVMHKFIKNLRYINKGV